MIKNTDKGDLLILSRRGSYTAEAAIFLPLVILAVLTIGFFIKADAAWENCMNGALDECSFSAAVTGSGPMGTAAASRVKRRISEDVPSVRGLSVYGRRGSCTVSGYIRLALPAGFGRDCDISGRIKYRDFIGRRYNKASLGTEGLERDESSETVWIFPLSGIRYHGKNCSYVKAVVHSCILTDALKRRYSACAMCSSGSLPPGSVVFCFSSDNTSYHRGSCRCINRHTIVIDRGEAENRGYSPCSKCGGK